MKVVVLHNVGVRARAPMVAVAKEQLGAKFEPAHHMVES